MNIREELYQYAYRENYVENTKSVKLEKKEAIIVYSIMFIIAGIFSIPMLLENTIPWFFITIASLIVWLFNTKEKNPYLRSALTFAIAFLYFGIVIAHAIVISSKIKFQIDRQSELIITSAASFLLYDIGVMIKIAKKKYSHKKPTIKAKTTRSNWDFFGPLLGAGIGRLLGRSFGDVSALDWLSILLCSIILALSLVFFQKYLICKLFYNKRIKNKS